MSTVTKRLFVDLTTSKVTSSLSNRGHISLMRFKANDAAQIGVQFYRSGDGQPELLESTSVVTFEILEKDNFGGTPLAAATAFTAATTTESTAQPDTAFYRKALDLSGSAITTALGASLPFIEALGEVSVNIANANPPRIFSSRSFEVILENDVIRGTEA